MKPGQGWAHAGFSIPPPVCWPRKGPVGKSGNRFELSCAVERRRGKLYAGDWQSTGNYLWWPPCHLVIFLVVTAAVSVAGNAAPWQWASAPPAPLGSLQPRSPHSEGSGPSVVPLHQHWGGACRGGLLSGQPTKAKFPPPSSFCILLPLVDDRPYGVNKWPSFGAEHRQRQDYHHSYFILWWTRETVVSHTPLGRNSWQIPTSSRRRLPLMACGPHSELLNYQFQMLPCDVKHIYSWSNRGVLGRHTFINNPLA